MKKFFGDDPIPIRYIHARERKAVVATPTACLRIVRRDQRIKNAKLPNDRRISIRQQVVRHVVAVSERPKLLFAIVAHTIDTNILRFEQRQVILQLDQLRAAVRSPDRGTVEHNDRFRIAPIGMVINEPTFLIQ